MKRLVLFLLAAAPVWLLAQNPEFGPLVETECGETTVMQPDNWTLYHTTTNTWDGPLDTDWCISVESGSPNSITLETGTYEYARPVYARLTTPDPMPLDPNQLYHFWGEVSPGVDWENTDWNENGWLGGCGVEISYPGDTAQGVEPYSLWYDANYTYDNYWGTNRASNCVATPYVEGATLTAFVLKLVFNPTSIGSIYSPYCDLFWDYQHITQDNAEYYIYGTQPSSMFLDWSYVLRYDESFGYPTELNPGYVDLYPEPNTAEAQVIEVEISEYGSLSYEPFTFLRGGLLEGSDADRHALQITNNSPGGCLQMIWEVVFPPNDTFIHENGNYDIGERGCMLFRRGATLEIAEGSTMRYGELGAGMLGLFEGANVVLNRGSTLYINNEVALWELDWMPETQEITIPLPEGSLLAFGDLARFREPPAGFKIKLLMEGGQVDFGGLDADERALFELVWPDAGAAESLQFAANPSPAPEVLWENRSEAPAVLRAWNTAGQLVLERALDLPQGQHRIVLYAALRPGLYVVRLEQAGGAWQGEAVVR